MPLFEDETLEGAVRKAVRGLRSKGRPYDKYVTSNGATVDKVSTRTQQREERFNDQRVGSCIAGSGSSGYGSLSGAISAVARQMERLARTHYPDRFDAIMSGQRHPRVMIPELAAAIELQLSSGGSATYRFSGIRAGSRLSNGSGRFEVPYTSDLAAVIHSHWLENRASDDDNGQKIRTLNYARRDSKRVHVRPEDIQFWVYSPIAGLRQY